jgi:hypothetical protein|tara:strand:- start:169 stop:2229 length:2061 start_codon:yes stop_codon:yes gene_type:complete
MKLGPKEIKVVNQYLIRPVKNRLKEIFEKKSLPQLQTADEIKQPPVKKDVEDIQAINEFVKRNPRADGGRIPFGDGSITKVQQLTEAVRKSPRLVKLFNEGNLYHIRTTIGGSKSNRKNYRGSKEELKKILKKRQSTGKPVKLTAKMKSNIKEYEDRTGKKYKNLDRYKQMKVRKGKQETIGTLPTKEEMKKRISIKQKGNAGVIEDVTFPNPKMKEKFLNELRLKYTYVPGKTMPEKYQAKNFAKRYPISERQFERMVSFYVNKEGLKYPKGGAGAEVIAQRKKLLKKISGPKAEDTIIKTKTPLLAEKNLSGKIDFAHRVSKAHMNRLGLVFDTQLTGMDSRLINQAIIKPAENALEPIYKKQFNVMKKIENSGLNEKLEKELLDINNQVKEQVKKTSGRIFGITIDPKTLEPSFEGLNKKFFLSSKNINLKELDKLPKQERIKILSPIVSKAVDAEIKRGFRPADFKEILQDKKSRETVLNYTKRFAPDILGKVKKAISNPASKESFALYANPLFSPGVLGEAFKTIPTPAGAVALNLGLGVDPTSAVDRASIAAEAAFAPQLVKQSAKFGPVAQRFFNLGLTPAMAARVARIASPLGIASLVAEGVYQLGKFTKKRTNELRSMTPEQREKLQREGEAFAFSEFAAAGGGLAKLAGDRSGAMLKSMNEDKDGLPSLLKRVKKT